MTAKRLQPDDIDLDRDVIRDRRGRRITEARAAAIAESVMQAHRAGRPSLTAPRVTSPEIKARVPQDLRDRVVQRAVDTGRTTSEIVRDALEKYLAS